MQVKIEEEKELIKNEEENGKKLKKGSKKVERILKKKLEKQARKSSEDTHFTEYARFEKVWAG